MTTIALPVLCTGELKKEKIEKEGKIKSQHPWFCLQKYTWLSSLCIQNLNIVALIDSELIRWKKLFERKKKGQIKGLISHMWLILLYTVQPVIPDVCTKFQNPRSSSS